MVVFVFYYCVDVVVGLVCVYVFYFYLVFVDGVCIGVVVDVYYLVVMEI